VPKILIVEHKTARRNMCAELLQRNEDDRGDFLSRIIADIETWIHKYDPLTKRQSIEWHHQSSPRKKKFKVQTSAGKVMASIVWESEGNLLVEFLDRGALINSERYVQGRIRKCWPNRKMNQVVLLRNNATPHTSLLTEETIATMGWSLCHHTPYSPDLAPSDFRVLAV
jgi:histone-lysine N-methyltransferase SETMAR